MKHLIIYTISEDAKNAKKSNDFWIN